RRSDAAPGWHPGRIHLRSSSRRWSGSSERHPAAATTTPCRVRPRANGPTVVILGASAGGGPYLGLLARPGARGTTTSSCPWLPGTCYRPAFEVGHALALPAGYVAVFSRPANLTGGEARFLPG